jgi:hypothetical protein
MQFQPGKPRSLSVLASMLAAAGIVLTVASCSVQVTPLGPDGAPSQLHLGSPVAQQAAPIYQLGSPIVVQAMRTQFPTATGKCLAGWSAFTEPGDNGSTCYRPIGKPVTITAASVSSLFEQSPTVPVPPSGQAGPVSYGFRVAVPRADVAAVTAVIKQAYDSQGAVAISVDGKIWSAPRVAEPFQGQQFQVFLPSKNLALQLQRILIPPS